MVVVVVLPLVGVVVVVVVCGKQHETNETCTRSSIRTYASASISCVFVLCTSSCDVLTPRREVPEVGTRYTMKSGSVCFVCTHANNVWPTAPGGGGGDTLLSITDCFASFCALGRRHAVPRICYHRP